MPNDDTPAPSRGIEHHDITEEEASDMVAERIRTAVLAFTVDLDGHGTLTRRGGVTADNAVTMLRSMADQIEQEEHPTP